MNKEPVVTTNDFETHVHTSALFVDNILRAANRLPHGEPDTYGATPLDRMATLRQQIDLGTKLQRYTINDLPIDVPLPVIDYVCSTFISRFHKRAEANEENYETALHPKQDFETEPQLMDMFKRAELGQASPSELLVTRQLRGIRSVELACLTHPYGSRIGMLPEMRKAVHAHVELLGGIFYTEPETRYRVKDIIGEKHGENSFRNGLLMTRKRTLAELPDGTIIRERSSLVLRTDKNSIISDEEIEALRSVDANTPDYQDALVKAAHLDELAALLLDADEFTLAIPIATTIYAFNPKTARLVEQKYIERKQREREEFAKKAPLIAAAMNGTYSVDLPNTSDSMLYIGPDPQDTDL